MSQVNCLLSVESYLVLYVLVGGGGGGGQQRTYEIAWKTNTI